MFRVAKTAQILALAFLWCQGITIDSGHSLEIEPGFPEFEERFNQGNGSRSGAKPKGSGQAKEPGRTPKVLVELDGTGSEDPDGDSLSYRWVQIDGTKVILSKANTAKPFFKTAIPGRYRFSLTVSDGKVRSDPAIISVEVERPNLPPQAVLASTMTVVAGVEFILDGSKSRDGDGDTLKYKFSQTAGPQSSYSGGLVNSGKLNLKLEKPGIYEFQLAVSDGKDWSHSVACRLIVRSPNQRPVARVSRVLKRNLPRAGEDQILKAPKGAPIAVVAQANIVTSVGNAVTLDGSDSYSGRKRPLLFFWQQRGGPFIGQFTKPKGVESKRNFTPEIPGTYLFQLLVNDGEFDSLPVRVEVKVVEGNMPPVAVIKGPKEILVGNKIVLDGNGSFDRESTKLTYTWRQTAGTKITTVGASGEGGRIATFVPRTNGVYKFGLTVSDGRKNSKEAEQVVIVKAGNKPPSVIAVEELTVKPGELFLLSAKGVDPENAPLEYTWRQVEGPVIMKQPARQRQVQLRAEDRGKYCFEVRVSDGQLISPPAKTTIRVGDLKRHPAKAFRGGRNG